MPVDGSELDLWDFPLPEKLIARYPAAKRSSSRLMVLRQGAAPVRHHFHELADLLRPGDLLVGNNTKVMAARIAARRSTGGRVELLVLDPGPGDVRAMVRPLKKIKPGELLTCGDGSTASLVARVDGGLCMLRFSRPPVEVMESVGAIPLPPYLNRDAEDLDSERYQTVFAGPQGACAAPTAGLHFDPALFAALAERGVGFATVTLHVGPGTFRPLREEDLVAGKLHEEAWSVPQSTVDAIRETRTNGGRIISIGTTTARTLESATAVGQRVPTAGQGVTDIFIRPGRPFRVVDGLITNFHLPRSSLLMLVAALCGRDRLFQAYKTAIADQYRFYSYGDAMLLF
ncbi:MAG: tRNA preQ1(34) S-adenosylmethionine ribosyltransferase-isomerase QueA [Rhodobacterales bacterium]|nr:tRNA preQ1(34) S-adenosylmethionine ribosyltransferase-isomerase QueA [Rhodobacterales bacterium]